MVLILNVHVTICMYAKMGDKSMKRDEISQLVREIQSSNDSVKGTAAFDHLFKSLWSAAYYYCFKWLRNEHDAEDAAQEAFLIVHKTIYELNTPEAFNKFFNTILTRVCIKHSKRDTRYKEQIEPLDFEDIGNTVLEQNEEFLPEAVVYKKEIKEKVAALVDNLPDKQREAVMLYYFSELKQNEICEITKSELSAVNKRLVMARKTLRNKVEELLKKGDLDYMRAATPMLTKILWEEAAEVCTPEIGDRIWRSIAEKLGLDPNAFAQQSVKKAKNMSKESVKESMTQAAKKTSNLLNVGIAATVVTTILIGGVLGVNIHRYATTNVPPAVVPSEQSIEDIIAVLKRVHTKQELKDFTLNYTFNTSDTESYEDGLYTLYVQTHSGRQIRVGSFEGEDGIFHITYEVTEPSALVPDSVKQWFEENSM